MGDCRAHGRLSCPRGKRASGGIETVAAELAVDRIGANSLGAIENPGSPSGRLESFPVQGAFGCPVGSAAAVMHRRGAADRHAVGFLFSSQAIRRQLTAMPSDTYLICLIHHDTRQPFPGE